MHHYSTISHCSLPFSLKLNGSPCVSEVWVWHLSLLGLEEGVSVLISDLLFSLLIQIVADACSECLFECNDAFNILFSIVYKG